MRVLFRGLTWDHARGREPLEAAAERFNAEGRDRISWDSQPLEGFEAASIVELAAQYDVIVIDHPHLGEAVSTGALVSVGDVLGERLTVTGGPGAFVGPSWESYTVDGRLWALPLDAATQTAASWEGIRDLPTTWDDVREFARRHPIALSLAGPHALMTLFSMTVARGVEPGPRGELPAEAVADALDTMTTLSAGRADLAGLNPIGLLERLADGTDIVYCPLVYQYVTYSFPTRRRRLRFTDAPAGPGGRRGSVIGGTGLALSRRCTPSDELLDHLTWLVSDEAQRTFIPEHAGQPARVAAWNDPEVNAASLDFYAGTLDTISQSWVRPRHDGFPAFQNRAASAIRAACAGETTVAEAAAGIAALLRTA